MFDGALRLCLVASIASIGAGLPFIGCSSADHANPGTNGTWTDPSTQLVWQDPPFTTKRNWNDSVSACDALVLGDYGDWRLPTIDELRTLARGCAATVTGGACAVSTKCLESSCGDSVCQGCEEYGGPAADGAYRIPSLTGDFMTTWSSSVAPDVVDQVWTVGFGGCHVLLYPKSRDDLNVRCVR